MRKTREVLRLYFDLKLGQRQVARSANVSQSTVHEYLERFTAAGLRWPLPAEMTEGELEARLFPADPGKDQEPTAKRPLPDFTHIHEELLQPLLLSLPALEAGTRCGAAPGASSGRKAVRRLGGRNHAHLRSAER